MQNYEKPIITVLVFEGEDVFTAFNGSTEDDIGGIPDGWGGVN